MSASTELPGLHAIEIEQRIIGAILVDNTEMERCVSLCREHFADPMLGSLFEVAAKLIEGGRLASAETLWPDLQNNQAAVELGGRDFVRRLLEIGKEGIQPSHVDVVRDLALRRQGVTILKRGAAALLEAGTTDNPRHILEAIEGEISSLSHVGHGGGLIQASSLMDETLRAIEEAYQADGQIVGVPTGLRLLDRALGGLRRKTMTVLGGRPGMGKTALAASIALNAARAGHVVAVFSLEMTGTEWGLRWLSDEGMRRGARREYSAIGRGQIDTNTFSDLFGIAREIGNLPIYLDERQGLSMAQIRAELRRLQRRLHREGRRIGLVIIDHLGLAEHDGPRQQGTYEKTTAISKEIKRLAKLFDVPALALTQLSREVERRQDKRPIMSDLRDSGSIEQDADTVLLAYRSAYYIGAEEPPERNGPEHKDWRAKMDSAEHEIEVVIGKNRHGRCGTCLFDIDLGVNAVRNQGDLYKPLDSGTHPAFAKGGPR